MSNIGMINDQEILSNNDILFDRIMLSLKLIKGIIHKDINKDFNIDFSNKFNNLLSELTTLELIEDNTEKTKLTDKGILISNEITLKFFQEICNPLHA